MGRRDDKPFIDEGAPAMPPDPVIVSTQASYLQKYFQDTEIKEKKEDS